MPEINKQMNLEKAVYNVQIGIDDITKLTGKSKIETESMTQEEIQYCIKRALGWITDSGIHAKTIELDDYAFTEDDYLEDDEYEEFDEFDVEYEDAYNEFMKKWGESATKKWSTSGMKTKPTDGIKDILANKASNVIDDPSDLVDSSIDSIKDYTVMKRLREQRKSHPELDDIIYETIKAADTLLKHTNPFNTHLKRYEFMDVIVKEIEVHDNGYKMFSKKDVLEIIEAKYL